MTIPPFSPQVLDAATLEEVAALSFKSGDPKKTVAEQQVAHQP